MGAWIETDIFSYSQKLQKLLPLWEHGLKHKKSQSALRAELVAPFMGAWIETFLEDPKWLFHIVAPFMGAWIETENYPKLNE